VVSPHCTQDYTWVPQSRGPFPAPCRRVTEPIGTQHPSRCVKNLPSSPQADLTQPSSFPMFPISPTHTGPINYLREGNRPFPLGFSPQPHESPLSTCGTGLLSGEMQAGIWC
jgi:hypothetical protein